MAVNEYITICTSGSELSKKFYAILNGYTEILQKAQTVEDNIEGDPLITNGGIRYMVNYVLKLSAEMADTSFGTKSDLKAMYALNNPNAEPSDVLTLIDHYGELHLVKFTGPLEMNPLTTMIDGEDSYFYTPIRFIEVINE
jgi:hypothetical protein